MQRLVIIASILGFAWVSWTYILDNPTYTFRYRLTLEVEAGGKRHVGSSVVEIAQHVPRLSLHPGTVRVSAHGEATAIDLGNGQVLVALLQGVMEETWRSGRNAREWSQLSPAPNLALLYGVKYDWRDGINDGLAQLVDKRGVKDIERDQLPTLLLFPDKTDPQSAVLVDPKEAFSGLSSGLRIVRAMIEVTDAPVTRKIENQLPWLSAIKGHLSGKLVCFNGDLTQALPFCPARRHLILSE